MSDAEIKLTCRTCGKDFIFTTAEQEFYQLKGFTLPSHCKECRQVKERIEPIICAACGREIEKLEGVYCTICHELICEHTTEEVKKLAEDLRAELLDAKSSSTESLETIKEKDQRISQLIKEAESLHKKINTLGHKVKQLSQDLEEAHQLEAILSSVKSLFINIEGRLEDIIDTQNLLGKRMMDLVSMMREAFDRTSLWQIIKYKLNAFLRQNIKPETG